MTAWRPARPGDAAEMLAIAARVHPDYPERLEVFAERIALFPAGCFLLEDESGLPLGYALSHPWRRGESVALDTLIARLPDKPSCLYLHDVAMLPQLRGQGHARSLVDRLARLAAQGGFTQLALTAIDGAAGVWERLGFRDAASSTDGVPAGYGSGARYMTLGLA